MPRLLSAANYTAVEIGGSALFELGYHVDEGVNGMFLRPRLSAHRLSWFEKYSLHRLLHFAAFMPDAEVWKRKFDEVGLFQGGDASEFDEFPFWPDGLF